MTGGAAALAVSVATVLVIVAVYIPVIRASRHDDDQPHLCACRFLCEGECWNDADEDYEPFRNRP